MAAAANFERRGSVSRRCPPPLHFDIARASWRHVDHVVTALRLTEMVPTAWMTNLACMMLACVRPLAPCCCTLFLLLHLAVAPCCCTLLFHLAVALCCFTLRLHLAIATCHCTLLAIRLTERSLGCNGCNGTPIRPSSRAKALGAQRLLQLAENPHYQWRRDHGKSCRRADDGRCWGAYARS